MIDTDYVRLMANYNAWQNNSLYGAADGLSDDDRRKPRGAFFGSIHATLNHILWGDQIWMSRFSPSPRPSAPSIADSVGMITDWAELNHERKAFDSVIKDWAKSLEPDWLRTDLTWFSGAAGQELTKPSWVLVTHMFNHQTHHRGQVHAMLTAAGASPEPTDLPFGSYD